MRARELPTVSAPLSWDEVETISRTGRPRAFRFDEVLDRVAADGDLFAPLLETGSRTALPTTDHG